MRKYLYTIIFAIYLFPFDSAFSQTAEFTRGKGFEGYIFSKEIFVFVGIRDQELRFTPSFEAIEHFECRLVKRINSLTRQLPDQGPGCPPINRRTLKKYTRQYFGFITKNDEKVLFVNFVWSKGIGTENLDKDLVSVLDGCSHYWNIQYNFTTDAFYGLDVNTRG